jgi:hypothetical protein
LRVWQRAPKVEIEKKMLKRTKSHSARKPTAEQPSSLEVLRKHRITRVRRQNEKLALELKKAKGELVPVDAMKHEVLAANAVVKSQLLALPRRLADQMAIVSEARECARILETSIVQCLNDLAYGTPPEDGTCPCCGKMKEKPE